jgi:hypothetical protein
MSDSAPQSSSEGHDKLCGSTGGSARSVQANLQQPSIVCGTAALPAAAVAGMWEVPPPCSDSIIVRWYAC